MPTASVPPDELSDEEYFRESLPKIAAAVLIGQALGSAITVGLAAAAFRLRLQQLVTPYAMFFACGIALVPLLYWTRLARRHPQSFRVRRAIALVVYAEMLMLALGLSGVYLGLLSRADAIGAAPFVTVAAGACGYLASRIVPNVDPRLAARR